MSINQLSLQGARENLFQTRKCKIKVAKLSLFYINRITIKKQNQSECLQHQFPRAGHRQGAGTDMAGDAQRQRRYIHFYIAGEGR